MDIAPDIDRAPARPAGGFAKPSAEQDQRTLVITRTLNAPRELVFEAWSRPEHWVKWWGTLPHCEQEVRVRGAFRFCMRAPDPGSGTGAMRDHWVRGEYTYIDPPSRLIFTWLREDGEGDIWCDTVVSIALEQRGKSTLLTLEQTTFATVAHCEEHAIGWGECLDRMTEYVVLSAKNPEPWPK